MILWTIQHKNAYENMLRTGRLVASEEHLLLRPDECNAYPWIAQRMAEIIGPPPEGVCFPVWAWYQWEGVRKRPDMRTHRFCDEKGTPIVLLTVDIPADKVLLSDFDMWHCVLSDMYLPLTEEEDKDYFTEEEKIRSWDNMFNYDLQNDYWGIDCKSTQATMWEIKKEWVLKTEHFISG